MTNPLETKAGNEQKQEKEIQEFRDTGLLLLVNHFLHVFGWAIVVDVNEDGENIRMYPARVKYRGFDNEYITQSHKKISDYIVANAEELQKEAHM